MFLGREQELRCFSCCRDVESIPYVHRPWGDIAISRLPQGEISMRGYVNTENQKNTSCGISMRGYVNTENQKNTSCGIFRLGRKPLPRRLVTSFLSALCSGSMPGCLLRSVFGLPLSSRTLSPNLTTQSPGRGVGCLRNGFRALGGVPVKSFPCSYPATRRVPTRRGRPPWRRFSRQARRRTPCRTSAWRA